jgi:PAS domain S-box-containing protein
LKEAKALRILNLGDSQLDAELIQANLLGGGIDCEVSWVQTRPDFAAVLEKGGFDLILSDYTLPSFDGLSALKMAREIYPEVPFIIVSGALGEEVAIESIRSGATDYVLKHRLERLVPAVRRAVREAEERRKRRRAEEALQTSEQRFRALIQNASDVVMILEADGTIRYESPAVERVLGYEPEEWVGTSVFDHLHPDDLEPARSSFAELLEKPDDRITTEYRVRNKQGSWRHFEAVGTNLLNDPVIRGIVINSRDLTERKRAEEALRVSEERFRATFDQAAVGVAQVAPDGRWLRVNQRLCQITGYAEEELLEKTFQDITYPEDLEADLEQARRLLVGEIETYSMEKRCLRKDGSTVWIDLTVSLVRAPSGEPDYFIAVIEDISERVRVEEALVRSKESYRTFVEQSMEGIWRFGLEQPLPVDTPEDEQIEHFYRYGYLAECNDAMARMYGFSRANELPGVRIGDLLPRSAPENVAYLRAFVRSGYRLTEAESYEIDRWGNPRYFLNNLTGFVEDGSLVQIWGTQQDITERRRVEEALRQSEELYRTVIEQAAENIFLVDAKTKQILEANDALHRSLGYTAEEMQRLTLYDIVAHDRESVDRFTQHILDEGRFSVGERKYRRKNGTLLDVEVNVSAIPRGGRVAMCITAHDVTERKRAEDMLRRSLDALLALYEAGHVLGSTLEAEEVGTRLLRIMQRVSSLSTAVISRPDVHGQLRVWRAVGLENLPKKIRYTSGVEATLQSVLESGEQRLFQLASFEEDARHLVGLGLPLRIRNRSIGLLEVYGPEDLLEEDTVDILGSMTSQAASALENARLYGELAEREKRLEDLVGKLLAAQEEERRRVAYEVHDGLAQVAVAAHQRLQAFSRRHPPQTERGGRDLQRVARLVRQTVSDARKIIANLRPTVLDDFGLAAAVSLEIERLREDGYQVDYEEELGDERLPDTVEISLFRIAQEALTNVHKHARTEKIRVELRRRRGEVCLEVRDYGRGFDPTARPIGNGPGERVGVAGMQERIVMLGGEFEIRSKPGEGTSVIVTLPV